MEEIRRHLAYRWFTRLGFEQEVPDHSTFSKNRPGRFRESGIFLAVFEEVVRRCIQAGLVGGQRMTVDGTVIRADASLQSGVERKPREEVAQVSRTVREYLAEVARQNPVADRPPAPRSVAAQIISKTDPDACWIGKWGPSAPSYLDHYLIDNAPSIIGGVEATPACVRQESLAARRLLQQAKERFGMGPESLGADKGYGSGEFLAWLWERKIQPHIPVIDRRHQTRRRFTRDAFQYDPAENAFRCPEGKWLRYRGVSRRGQSYLYSAKPGDCGSCPVKKRCTPGPYRKVSVHWQEAARQRTRDLISTPAYARSRRERNKVKALFSELKLRVGLKRVRLRRLWNVAEQFYLAATAQNLKRLVKFIAQSEALPAGCAT